MIVKDGPASHSPFKLESLLIRLQSIDPNVIGLGARFIHLIDAENELSEKHDRILGSILEYGPDWSLGANEGFKIFILPRFGTNNILKPGQGNKAYSPLDNGSVHFNKESDALLYTEIRNPETGGGGNCGNGTPPFARLLDSSADSSLNSSSHSSSNNLISAAAAGNGSASKRSDAEVVKDIINSSDLAVKLKSPATKKTDKTSSA